MIQYNSRLSEEPQRAQLANRVKSTLAEFGSARMAESSAIDEDGDKSESDRLVFSSLGTLDKWLSRIGLLFAGDRTIPRLSHTCVIDSDCGIHALCNIDIGRCATKKLGMDLKLDSFMAVLGFIVAGISLAAGVGGGGLNVPLLMTVLSFDAHVATALSQAMLTGGAL